MKPAEVNLATLRADLKKLKVLLIISTVIQIAFFVAMFTEDKLWLKLYPYKINYTIGFFHIAVMAIFIWYNWKRLPIEKKKKTDNTYMILCLGIIGMWLWIPNERQIEKMNTY